MAYQLSERVSAWLETDSASDLTAAERLVLMLIAERASADGPYSGTAWDGDGWSLAARVGVTRLRQVLEKLGTRGLECRVAHGEDKSGKPVYAWKGRQTTYRLPVLPGQLSTETLKGASVSAPLGASVDAPSASVDAPSASVDAPSASVDAPSPLLPGVFGVAGNPPLSPPAFVPALVGGTDIPETQNRTSGEVETAQAFVAHLRTRLPTLDAHLSDLDYGRLTSVVAEALGRGVTPTQIADSIASRGLEGAAHPGRVISARIAALVPVRSVQADDGPCPLHVGQHVYRCQVCKGDILAGYDPYEGREDLRPADWIIHYPRAQRLVAS